MKRPIVGKMVHYVLEDGPYRGQHRAALIVGVPYDPIVNLTLFPDGSEDFPGSWPPLTAFRGAVHHDPAGTTPGSWHHIERG